MVSQMLTPQRGLAHRGLDSAGSQGKDVLLQKAFTGHHEASRKETAT